MLIISNDLPAVGADEGIQRREVHLSFNGESVTEEEGDILLRPESLDWIANE